MTTAAGIRKQKLDRAGAAGDGAVRRRPRRLDRQRRAADDRRRRSSFSQDNLSWVVNAYVLTFGGFLLLGGRLADLLGRRRVFMAGLILFALASLVGGFAESEGDADRRPRGPGPRRRDPLAGGALDRHHHLPRRLRAQQGARRLGRGRRRRRRRGRPARRRADRVPGLGVGAVGERADRDRRRGPRPAADRREPLGVREPRASTSPARSASPPGSRCSSTRWSRRPDAGWGSGQTIGLLARRGRPARRLRRDRAPLGRAAGPVLDLPAADAHRRQRGRDADRRLAVLDVLLHLALHAERARLQRDQGRALLPAARGLDHPRRRASPRSS